jgi:two-component system, NarL family, sensor kinase
LPFWAAPATAWALAGLTALLAAALVPLSLAARQNPLATEGANVVGVLSFAVVGLVVAWYRPRNPIGWLMLAVAVDVVFSIDGGLYNVLNYRVGDRLPFAPVVLLLYHASTPVLAMIPLMILLFPDGRLPSPRWRWAVGGYLTLAVADMIVQAQMVAYALTHHRTQVDTSGLLLLSNRQYAVVFAPLGLIFFACWFVAVGYQVVSWRRAAGERRQQLSWLMAGAPWPSSRLSPRSSQARLMAAGKWWATCS